MYKLLLACGAGASSGFVASSMRKSAKKKGIEVEIKAIGDAELFNYINSYDILLLGSHLEYKLADIKTRMAENGYEVPVALIDKRMYASLDGEGILNAALEVLQK